jgi:hypothetical protein
MDNFLWRLFMRYCTIALLLFLGIFQAVAKAADPDRFAIRAAAWQKEIDGGPFRFDERNANLTASLSEFRADCQLLMAYNPDKWHDVEFRFVRNGKEFLSIQGHPRSVFFTSGNTLYFADFIPISNGCTILKYDLTTGKLVWATKLTGLGEIAHSRYLNEVTMWEKNLDGTEAENEGAVVVCSHEAGGNYEEVVDMESGKILAHRIFDPGPPKIWLYDLCERGVQGSLDVPLGKVVEVSGVVIENKPPTAKADEGQPFFLRIDQVDGKPLATPQRFSSTAMPLIRDMPALKIGDTFHCIGYETGSFEGIPTDVFKYQPPMATTGYGFSTRFVIVKAK